MHQSFSFSFQRQLSRIFYTLEHYTLFRTLATRGNRPSDDLRLPPLQEVSSRNIRMHVQTTSEQRGTKRRSLSSRMAFYTTYSQEMNGSHCRIPKSAERSHHMPAPTKRSAECRQLDQQTELELEEVESEGPAERSQRRNTQGAKACKEVSRVKRKRTAIVQLLRHAYHFATRRRLQHLANNPSRSCTTPQQERIRTGHLSTQVACSYALLSSVIDYTQLYVYCEAYSANAYTQLENECLNHSHVCVCHKALAIRAGQTYKHKASENRFGPLVYGFQHALLHFCAACKFTVRKIVARSEPHSAAPPPALHSQLQL